jgi:hypothetical protein
MEKDTMRRLLVLFLISVFFITGCQTIPKDALTLSPEAKVLSQRQIQTRKYQTPDEAKILAACAGLLQDMGFNIDESETELGLISSSKMRSANTVGQTLVAILIGVPAERQQQIRACVVTRPVGETGESVAVRITFQRIVWDIEWHVTRSESLTDPKIYQEFFDKLSKAVFLEAQEI